MRNTRSGLETKCVTTHSGYVMQPGCCSERSAVFWEINKLLNVPPEPPCAASHKNCAYSTSAHTLKIKFQNCSQACWMWWWFLTLLFFKFSPFGEKIGVTGRATCLRIKQSLLLQYVTVTVIQYINLKPSAHTINSCSFSHIWLSYMQSTSLRGHFTVFSPETLSGAGNIGHVYAWNICLKPAEPQTHFCVWVVRWGLGLVPAGTNRRHRSWQSGYYIVSSKTTAVLPWLCHVIFK